MADAHGNHEHVYHESEYTATVLNESELDHSNSHTGRKTVAFAPQEPFPNFLWRRTTSEGRKTMMQVVKQIKWPGPLPKMPNVYKGSLQKSRTLATNFFTTSPSCKSNGNGIDDIDQEQITRGRSRARTTSIIPQRHRVLSPAATRRRLAPASVDLPDNGTQTFLTTDVVSPTLSTPEAIRNHLFEPKSRENVSVAVSEVMGSGSPPESLSPVSNNCNHVSPNSRPGSFRSTSSDDKTSPSSDSSNSRMHRILVNAAPPNSRTSYSPLPTSIDRFKDHRDTFAVMKLSRKHQPSPQTASAPYDAPIHSVVPQIAMSLVIHYLDHKSWCAARLTCRSWSSAATIIRSPCLPPIYKLPKELIQEVYLHLSLTDFNAARKTCRSWMSASEDENLLRVMLQREVWWPSVQLQLYLLYESFMRQKLQVMGRYLARESPIESFEPYTVADNFVALDSPDMSALPGQYFDSFDGQNDDSG